MRLTVLAAVVFCVSACASAPEPSDPEAFSRQAALSLTEELSRDALFGRAPNTGGSTKAQDLVTARMATLGLIPLGEDGYRDPFVYGDFADRETGESETPNLLGVNLIGKIEGRSDSSLALVVTAHYDHVGVIEGEIYNGADDNASGVGALMAVAEYFTIAQPRYDVIIAALDAEETGFHGARALVLDPPLTSEVMAANLNLDMVARGDNGNLWASGASHTPALVPLIEAVAADAPVTLQMGFDTGEGRDDWTMLSDHAVFFRSGIPHLYLGVEDHDDYHTPRDDFSKIDQAWFASSMETIVMVAAAMAEDLDEIEKE
ncbi:MAG: M28 family peptidase [Pseudomonadota bacterium]